MAETAGNIDGRIVDIEGRQAVISNCPQINNPVIDYNPIPMRVVVWNP